MFLITGLLVCNCFVYSNKVLRVGSRGMSEVELNQVCGGRLFFIPRDATL